MQRFHGSKQCVSIKVEVLTEERIGRNSLQRKNSKYCEWGAGFLLSGEQSESWLDVNMNRSLNRYNTNSVMKIITNLTPMREENTW